MERKQPALLICSTVPASLRRDTLPDIRTSDHIPHHHLLTFQHDTMQLLDMNIMYFNVIIIIFTYVLLYYVFIILTYFQPCRVHSGSMSFLILSKIYKLYEAKFV